MRTSFRLISSLALKLGFLAGLVLPAAAQAAKPYQYALVGNPAAVVLPAPATPGLVLMGGGADVDDAFRYMIKKAGGGNFVVIRATGTDAYNPYIYAFGGASSVETLVIPSREAANDPFVIARIQGAEALFIAGGDQSDYIKLWQGTPVQTAIDALARKNLPIGGTSAGLAVMSKYLFTALNGGVTSPVALGNPYDRSITLGRDFLNLPDMGGLITDSHLDSRDRMGRLVTFMARIVNDGWAGSVRGIGIDVDTALLVDNGSATRVGTGSAYFLNTVGLPEVCKPKTPLTYRNVMTQRLSGSGSFDVRNWASYNGATTNYAISAVKGVLSSTQPGGAVY
jgi:cyanophycinase